MRKYNYKAFKRKQENIFVTRVTEKDFFIKFKDILKKMNKEPQAGKNIHTKYIVDKGFVSRICKEVPTIAQ